MPAATTASAAAEAFGRARLILSGKRAFSRQGWRPLTGGRLALALLSAPAFLAVLSAPVPAVAQQGAAADTGIATEIRSLVSSKYRDFYRDRGYWPLWVEEGRIGPAADALIALVATADLDGLKPSSYNPDRLRDMVAEARKGDAKLIARAELQLSRTLVDYVRDMRRNPGAEMRYLDKELEPARPSEVAVLREAGVAPSLKDYVAGMGWMNPIYAGLRAGLADYHSNWADLPDIEVGAGERLRSGSRGDRVAALRERLGLPAGQLFDKALATKVRGFQSAHGLTADGVVGDATLAAINRGPHFYEKTLLLNLDRARVLPGSRTRYIVVDAAAARLWMYDKGKVEDTMRVVVGKPTEQTPMMAGMMRYVTLNPYWNVPEDLVRDRLAPRILKQRTSLDTLGYEALSDYTANATLLDPATIDWTAVAAGQRDVRVRQLPGRDNAMGRIKFMFPNDLGVYLHDTPDKDLFRKPVRRFSSGCVRLEDARKLEIWLFGKAVEAPSAGPEQAVWLPRPMPVYLTYFTAFPDGKGVTFRNDPYGRDGDPQQMAAR